MSEGSRPGGDPSDDGLVRRTLGLLFAPVGLAVNVAEELPGFVTEGRRRIELQIANARVVGRFVVGKSQRRVAERFGCSPRPGGTRPEPAVSPPVPMTTRPAPVPDTAAEAVVEGALADYDTLSASQVVRRLESLGPAELRAVQRYESTTRNRRTILNRASQLLEEHRANPPAP